MKNLRGSSDMGVYNSTDANSTSPVTFTRTDGESICKDCVYKPKCHQRCIFNHSGNTHPVSCDFYRGKIKVEANTNV